MTCPECKIPMFVWDSRSFSATTRMRTYICMECGRHYVSTETLDEAPFGDKGVPKSLIKRVERSKNGSYEKEA